MTPIVDSHCHLDYPPLDQDLAGVLRRMDDNGVGAALAISTELGTHERLCRICGEQPRIRCTAGVHPCHVENSPPTAEELVEQAGNNDKVVAIGETGLDFYRDRSNPNDQATAFSAHIQAARSLGKPLVIHTRNSFSETIAQLRAEGGPDIGGVFHCFTGTWEEARQALDIGFLISFTGIITFKSARDVRDILAKVPSDRYMVETDAPYLAPEPHRGRGNEPAYVRLVAEKCAEIREVPLEQVAEETTANFNRLFGQAVGRDGIGNRADRDQNSR